MSKKPDLESLVAVEPVSLEPTEDDIDDLDALLEGYNIFS